MKKGNPLFFQEALPLPARLYVLAVIGLGFGIALNCLAQIAAEASWQWLYLAGLTVVVSCFAIKIPLARGKKGSLTISISDFCIFAALFLFGPHVAVIIAALEGVVSGLRVRINKLYKYLFNIAQLALAAYVLGEIFHSLQSGILLRDVGSVLGGSELLLKILVCSLLYFGLNSFLVAAAVALVSVQSLAWLWKVNFFWFSPSHFFNASLAATSAVSVQPLDQVFVLAAVALILGTFYAYRIGLNRRRPLRLC